MNLSANLNWEHGSIGVNNPKHLQFTTKGLSLVMTLDHKKIQNIYLDINTFTDFEFFQTYFVDALSKQSFQVSMTFFYINVAILQDRLLLM